MARDFLLRESNSTTMLPMPLGWLLSTSWTYALVRNESMNKLARVRR
jgi:hypothetical protein